MTEICNECGRSVAGGSGRFVNRIPDLNDVETRKQMGKPFPDGDFMCQECEDKYYNESVDDFYQKYLEAFKNAYGYYPQYSPVSGKKVRKDMEMK